ILLFDITAQTKSNNYLEAARELGNYLLRTQDLETKSWQMPWNTEVVDGIVTFYAIG
ncbi:MAG: hypothetical protein GYA14_02220, partial [Ignavibacteria bacterium]|nr:hypothetical protein [Ignavibacteria bacterium]